MEDKDYKSENVIDANLFKKNKKLKKDKIVDDIIKGVVVLHKKVDDSLKELSNMCCKEKDGKRKT